MSTTLDAYWSRECRYGKKEEIRPRQNQLTLTTSSGIGIRFSVPFSSTLRLFISVGEGDHIISLLNNLERTASVTKYHCRKTTSCRYVQPVYLNDNELISNSVSSSSRCQLRTIKFLMFLIVTSTISQQHLSLYILILNCICVRI